MDETTAGWLAYLQDKAEANKPMTAPTPPPSREVDWEALREEVVRIALDGRDAVGPLSPAMRGAAIRDRIDRLTVEAEARGRREALTQDHGPCVTPGRDGWVVYCNACSHEAGDYVYPCRVQSTAGWPPQTLTEGRRAEPTDAEVDAAVETLYRLPSMTRRERARAALTAAREVQP